MIPKAYAHSLPDKPQEEWQPLDEHLRAVAEKAWLDPGLKDGISYPLCRPVIFLKGWGNY